ncbi:PhoX family protein [Bordetella genomosp. 1]|uniref:Alkaline phosphatase n=1 Tax=Bordetella genomosp. 1 TaxID=1395607 RepID=A0ABX4F095_9BORD|nr:alkaline phosphatase PhoX [Bordetella genomosp. 1]OZI65416.1 alkaline phosphatase [Bordetella genomosp. 1]
MPQSSRLSRRDVLKFLGSAPMLPLATGAGASALLAACAQGQRGQPAQVSFLAMPAPTLADPAAMARTTVGSRMVLRYPGGREETVALAYEPFFMTGDEVPDGRGGTLLAGGYLDIRNQPIMDTSVPGRARQFFSDCPDGMSMLTLPDPKVAGVKGNTVFAVVQFEYTTFDQAGGEMYGKLPSPIAVLTLDQDPATGHLALVQYRPVDTSAVHGLWITCGASLSPWNTHLSSEEYEPDAISPKAKDLAQFKAYSRNLYGDENAANPYHYGHLPEVVVQPDGSGVVKKHYCLGRISHELIQVMPDRRTALMGDDATNGGLFLFVADRAEDLSAGTLYVARWHQQSGTGPGSATLDWVRLGHATSDEIRALADRLRGSDIMDVSETDPGVPGYTRIPFAGRHNWVRIKPGMAQAAAFLETHRYAALAGGSLGFTKMEGTTVNVRDRVAYSAMSRVEASMLDGSGGIKVEGPKAGAVYALNLRGGQKDTEGRAIDSEWVPVDMAPPAALVGVDLKQPDALGNVHDAERISNPDNLKFSEKLRTLFIGEDSGGHVNNFLWAYNVDTRQLARVLSCPVAAESTGLQAVDELNGWTYITSNFQHAGDWNKLHDKVRPATEALVRANYRDRHGATVGYITGVKV